MAAIQNQSHEKLRAFTLLAGSSLTIMSGATISPALPDIAEHFGDVNNAEFLTRLVLTMPALFIALGAPVAGMVVDRWGRKRLFLLMTILYAAAGSSGLYLDSIYSILAGRAFLGLAVAGVMTACTTLIGDYYSGPGRHHFMGLQASWIAFGGVAFQLAGGFLADVDWRWPFAVYLTSLIIVPGIAISIYEHKRQSSHSSTEVPLDRAPLGYVTTIYVLGVLGMAAFYMLPVLMPFYLRGSFGASGSEISFALAFVTLSGAVIAWHYSRVKKRLGFPFITAILFLLMGCGYLLIAQAPGYMMLYVGLMFAGLGMGLLMPNLNVWLLAVAPERLRGRLVGGLTTSIFVGQFITPILIRPLVQNVGTPSSYEFVGYGLLVMALGFAVFSVLKGRVRALATEPAEDQVYSIPPE